MSPSEYDFRLNTRAGRDLRERLDALTYEEVVDELGEPDRVESTTYRSPWWSSGDGRPALATDDVAVVQAMARCMAWRERGTRLPREGVHPGECNWCPYPAAELKAAIGWAGTIAGFIATSVASWRGEYGSHYIRATPQEGTYGNPRWAAWFSDHPDRRSAHERRREEVHRAMYE